MTLYDDLGVDENASDEEIKAAYRRKAKKTHPDAGGDAETFGALTKAYEVLSDPKARARYDDTGETESLGSIDKRAEAIIGELFAEMLRRAEQNALRDTTGLPLITSDLVKEMRVAIRHGQTNIGKIKERAEKKKRQRERLRLKISGKIMERIIDQDIHQAASDIEKAEHETEASKRALEMLGDYSHQPDDRPEHDIPSYHIKCSDDWINSPDDKWG